LTLGAALSGGGGISELATLFELGVASNGGLDAGLFEFARDAFDAGVTELPLDSPIVMRMNSLIKPSSLYVSCIGLEGCEYKAFTIVLFVPACATIDLKSLTLMTMCSFSSTANSPNSKVSIAMVVCKGCFRISTSLLTREMYYEWHNSPFPDMIFSVKLVRLTRPSPE
jgi:hypothetical protein